MNFTVNASTAYLGVAAATCLARTVDEFGNEIVTWEMMYPRYVHPELMTHRMFSRNACSSRATPLHVTLEEVRKNPMFFNSVGKNRSGMVAGDEVSFGEKMSFFEDWKDLANEVADRVEGMSAAYGIHKQVLNRALEPFLPIRTIVTATELDNFFKLRLAKDAQPEMRALALAMKMSMLATKVDESTTHMPYAEFFPDDNDFWALLVRCTAACCRVCVGKQEGRKSTLEEDKALVKMLLEKGHMTPLEHCARAEGTPYAMYANFRGWKSLRYLREKEGEKVFGGLID